MMSRLLFIIYYPDEGGKPKRLYNTFLISTCVVVALYTFNPIVR